ncbi:MAG: O-antigen ligase family protein [Planctomycetota bacterium]|nr:MAG: O-antigen ligase family protein [Planctomycetota bacterium]
MMAVPAMDRWMITGFLLAIAIPPEAQFSLGALVLSPQRVLLMVAMVPAALRVIGDRRLGLRLLDGLALLHVLWAWLSVCKVHGVNSMSVEAGGIYTIEFLGSYLLGRALIASPAHAVFFAKRLLLFIFVLAMAAIPEMLTGKHLIRETFGSVFGSRNLAGVTPRFGLTRAFASFDHPILWGVFAASALGMTWYMTRARHMLSFGRIWRCVAIVGAAFTSLSTGPLMACTVQLGILGWDVVTRGIKGRWWVLMAGAIAAYIAVDALSNRDPLTVFVHYLTFNAQTGYDRKLIWDIGIAQVKLTPLFGIGFNVWTTAPEWWHNTSVDAFWLLTALRYGLPGVLTLAALTLWTVIRMIRVPHESLRPLVMGWLVTCIGLSIAAMTVHLWGSTFVLFGFLLGMGVSVSGLKLARPTPRLPAPFGSANDAREPGAPKPLYLSEGTL